jgi:hypothetical protein
MVGARRHAAIRRRGTIHSKSETIGGHPSKRGMRLVAALSRDGEP